MVLTFTLHPSRYPVILSIENHCTIQQQKKIAQYLREIFGDKLDVGDVLTGESKTLPSPNSLKGKILIKVRTNTWMWLKWKKMEEALTFFCSRKLSRALFYFTIFHLVYVAENGCGLPITIQRGGEGKSERKDLMRLSLQKIRC